MKHINANLDDVTNIEVSLVDTIRVLGLNPENDVVEISPSSSIFTDSGEGGGGAGGDGGELPDNSDGAGGGNTESDQCVTLTSGSSIRFFEIASEGGSAIDDTPFIPEEFGSGDGEFYQARIDISDPGGLSRLRTLFPPGHTGTDFISVTPGTITLSGDALSGGRGQFRYSSAAISGNSVTLGGVLSTTTGGMVGTALHTFSPSGTVFTWGPVRASLQASRPNYAFARSHTFNLGTLLRTRASYSASNFVAGTFAGFQVGDSTTSLVTAVQTAINTENSSFGNITTDWKDIGFDLAINLSHSGGSVTFYVRHVMTGSNYLNTQLFFLADDGQGNPVVMTPENFISGSGNFGAALGDASGVTVAFAPYTPGGTTTRAAIEHLDGNTQWDDTAMTIRVCADGLGGGGLVGMPVDCDPISSNITFRGAMRTSDGLVYANFRTDHWNNQITYIKEAEQGRPVGVLSQNISGLRGAGTDGARAAANQTIFNAIQTALSGNMVTLDPASTLTGLVAAGTAIPVSDSTNLEVGQRFFVGSTKYTITAVGGALPANNITLGQAIGDGATFNNTGARVQDDVVADMWTGRDQFRVTWDIATVGYWPYNPGLGLDNRYLNLTYAPTADTPTERNTITGSRGTNTFNRSVVLRNATRPAAQNPTVISAATTVAITVATPYDSDYIVGERITLTTTHNSVTTTFDATIDSITTGTGTADWVLRDLSLTEDLTVSSITRIECTNTNMMVDVGDGGDTSLGDTEVDGDLDVFGDETVDGDMGVGGDLTVDGDGSLGGDLDVDGDLRSDGDLIVDGDMMGNGVICSGGQGVSENVSATNITNVVVENNLVVSFTYTNTDLQTTLGLGIIPGTRELRTGDYVRVAIGIGEDEVGTYRLVGTITSSTTVFNFSRSSGTLSGIDVGDFFQFYFGGTCLTPDGLDVEDIMMDGDLSVGGDMDVGPPPAPVIPDMCVGILTTAAVSGTTIPVRPEDISEFAVNQVVQVFTLDSADPPMFSVEVSAMNSSISAIDTTLNTITLSAALTTTIAMGDLAVLCRTGALVVPPPPDDGGMGSGLFAGAVYTGFTSALRNQTPSGISGVFNVASQGGNVTSFDIPANAATIRNINRRGISTTDGSIARITNQTTGVSAIVAFSSHNNVSMASCNWDGNSFNFFFGRTAAVIRFTVIQGPFPLPTANTPLAYEGIGMCTNAQGIVISREQIITESLRIGQGTTTITDGDISSTGDLAIQTPSGNITLVSQNISGAGILRTNASGEVSASALSESDFPDITYGDVFTYSVPGATTAGFGTAWRSGSTTGITPTPQTSPRSTLHNGDLVIIVNTTPTPDQMTTYLYVGADAGFGQATFDAANLTQISNFTLGVSGTAGRLPVFDDSDDGVGNSTITDTPTLNETIATDSLRDLEGVSMDTATLVVATGVDYSAYIGGEITFSADYTTDATDNDSNNVTAQLAGNSFTIVAGSTTNEIRFRATGIDIGTDGPSNSGSAVVNLAGAVTVANSLTVTGVGTIGRTGAGSTTTNGISFWSGTMAQYTALTASRDQNTIYYVTDA